MNLEPRVDIAAAALGDRARATIVCALMDGRAYTAKELAYRARVSAQTASFHLRLLVESGLAMFRQEGRNRYFALAGPEVAAAIEALGAVAPLGHLRRLPSRAAAEVRLARSCYDHIAGRLGVLIADHMAEAGWVLSRGGAFSLTPHGRTALGRAGLDVAALERDRRPLLRHCLDWTERRDHIAGALGNALLHHCLAESWLARAADSRALVVTAKGHKMLPAKLGLSLGALEPEPEVVSARVSAG